MPSGVTRGPGEAGWRAAHVGVEGDGLVVGGVRVWREAWRRAPSPAVDLPHPAHPGQTHRFVVYEAGSPASPATFAAGELSPGVWGFYVPV